MIDMTNFCTNCGTRLEDSYNFCTNCGTRIDKRYLKHNRPPLQSSQDLLEKRRARQELKRVTGGNFLMNKEFTRHLRENGLDLDDAKAIRKQVEMEIESGKIKAGGVEYRINQIIPEYKIRIERQRQEQKRKLRLVDEIFESDEIKAELRKGQINQTDADIIKGHVKEKVKDKKQNMSDDEIRDCINDKIRNVITIEKFSQSSWPEQQTVFTPRKSQTHQRTGGGYCDFSCRYYREEYLGSEGITIDFTGDEVIDHYCTRGYYVGYGCFCKHYER